MCPQKTRSQAYSRLYMVTRTRLFGMTGHLIMMHTQQPYIISKSESCLACQKPAITGPEGTQTPLELVMSRPFSKTEVCATISMGVFITCMDSPKGQPAERNQCCSNQRPAEFASGNTILFLVFSVTHPLLRRMLGYIDD